ncbi:MAG: PEP-utilizing enzyme [Desulfatiglandales bacterium]
MAKKFTDPHDIPTIPGTEGWERMYPYQYIFSTDDPDRAKHESAQLWYNDGLHYPDPHCPFDLLWDEFWFMGLSQNNTRVFCLPPAKGIEHRIVNGYVYIAPIGVEDPKEIEARVPLFMKRAGYYYDNWETLWDEWEAKFNVLLRQLEAVSFQALPEVEDESRVFDADKRGLSSGYVLLTKYDELINMGFKCWQYHFDMLNLCYAGFLTYKNTFDQIFPNTPIGTITKLVSGMDAMVMRPDAELIKLAKMAIDKGVDGILLKDQDAAACMKEMEGSAAGKEWLAQLEESRYPWFYISSGTGWYHYDASWNDNLNIPFASLKKHIESLKAGKDPSRPMEKLVAEKDRVTEEYRSLIQTDEDRVAFDQTLSIARRIFPYAENHMFYVEQWFHSVFWNKMRQVADILKDANFIEDREDIWYLKRGEIRDALQDYGTAWATGVKPRGPAYWPKEIEWRKGVMQKFKEWTPPPALGTPPEVMTEPFSIMSWGITDEVLQNWLAAGDVSGEEGPSDELKGSPGAPGVAEGKARIIKSVDELALLQQGEILVARITAPSWAPAFAQLKGAVTDVGGSMCHAAIICREYALPTVVGTGTATSAIKTGDLIRIDGDTGTVKILQRA